MAALTMYEELDYDIRRASGYHNMRAGFFLRWHRIAMFTVIVALLSPFVELAPLLTELANYVLSFLSISVSEELLSKFLSAAGAFAAVYDVMVNLGGRYAKHRAAELQYGILHARLSKDMSEAELKQSEQIYNAVESNFEERHVVVNIVSHNRVAEVLGLKKKEIPMWKCFLMHWFTFPTAGFK